MNREQSQAVVDFITYSIGPVSKYLATTQSTLATMQITQPAA